MSGVGGPIASATYMLPPMTRTADIDALEAWIADPDGAPRILVAEGRVKPKAALAWIMVTQWEKAGLVAIAAEDCARGERRWVAERRVCANPLNGRGPQARRGGAAAEPMAPDDTPVSDHIFRAIKRAANLGFAAPPLSELARGAGLKSAANADYYVRKLERRGAIRIDSKRFANGTRRQYHILDGQGFSLRRTDWGR